MAGHAAVRVRVCALTLCVSLGAGAAFAQPPAEPPTKEVVAPPATTPASGPPAAAAPSAQPAVDPKPATHGAIIVAHGASARSAAKALARASYADIALRPLIDEAMAQTLAGAPVSPLKPDANEKTRAAHAARAEAASVVNSVVTVTDDLARARLLTSLGEDLNAQLVLLVIPTPSGPTARVLRVSDKRFLTVSLAARRSADGKQWQWDDAVVIARGLLTAAPPGPRTNPKGPAITDEEEDDFAFLKSPWFWTGIGVALTAGITVIVLTQVQTGEPDDVLVGGRVVP